MTKSPSMILTKALDALAPTLGGVSFFFLIVGVFGLCFATGGLILTVALALAVYIRIPDEEVDAK